MKDNAVVGSLRVATNLQPTEWLVNKLHGAPLDVGTVVPIGFPAYARIFHPAERFNSDPTSPAREVAWAAIAAETGKLAHPLMQWDNVSSGRPDFGRPVLGTLPRSLAQELVRVLRDNTAHAGECWFGVWAGRQPLLIPGKSPTFQLPLDRATYLLQGHLSGLTQNVAPAPLEALPSLAWPADRAWVLATDVDLDTSYLAGTTDCIDMILTSPGIEAARVQPTDPVTADSDTLNGSNQLDDDAR